MMWVASEWEDVLRTEIISGTPENVLKKRIQLINEAIAWEGSIEAPREHVVGHSNDGAILSFKKPGKEAKAGTNPNDMRPTIKFGDSPLPSPSFAFIWKELTKIAVIDFEAFRAILILIYRSAYLLDHEENGEGRLRYSPSPKIKECITALDHFVGDKTEFRSVDGLLRFIDLLGWNEDVKYHSFEGKGTFTEGKNAGKSKTKIGRVNTFLTCIRIPFEVSNFMKEYQMERSDGKITDFDQLYDIMQDLINGRGVCPISMADLPVYLSPYLTTKNSGQFILNPLQRTLI
ncbi:MAG: hypothetical protein NT131_01305 [Methanomassiliicoccales archaeon]|nr:hypothetical protein [Methanomassiliicoccales archaeon]